MAEIAANLPPALELRAITKEFSGVRALDQVSFDLRRGEIHALCGENGAGKSTLIKILCGYYRAGSFKGDIRLDGRIVHFKTIGAAEARGLALIPQELAFVPELSVEENLLLGRETAGFGLIRRAAQRSAARRALDRVGLDVDPGQRMKDLGVGRQQMVEIARALAKNAAILVLDEPTAALPETEAGRLLDLLKELRSLGVSLIYVSHRLDEVFRIADRITVLRDGRAVATGSPAQLPKARVIELMVGREVMDLYPRPARRAGEILLEVRDWSLAHPSHPGRRVVDGVSFEVRAGEVLGIAGLVGAGRTELVTSLFGAAGSRPRGTIRIAGGEPRGPFRSPSEAMKGGLALLSEDRQRFGLIPLASVTDNLTLATLERFSRRGFLDGAARDRACGEMAAALSIRTPDLTAPVSKLSGGNQQKVVLGRWLLAEPRVLILDEPTRGIDVGARAEIYQWIGELTSRGLGVVLVSSDLPELLGLSHRLLVLSQGRPAARLDGETATPEAVMRAATSTVA